jgi:hypothetical protein
VYSGIRDTVSQLMKSKGMNDVLTDEYVAQVRNATGILESWIRA